MNQDQGTVLRSGRIIDSSSEIESPADPSMAQASSNDSETIDSSDISSQLSEIKESYERRISELHQEFSQLKDLMMAIVSKNSSESQPSSSKGPSKPAQQHGFDNLIHHGEHIRLPNELTVRVSVISTVTAPSETAKLVDIGILDLNMFRKFLKNSNLMFDVALSM